MGKGKKAGFGVGAMVGLALCAPVSRGVLFDTVADLMGSESTPQEKTIEEAINTAYGTDMDVRCMGQTALNIRLWPVGSDLKIYGYTVPLLPRIWLDKDVCNKVADFAASQEKELTNGDTVHALGVVAHEAAHHINRTSKESTAECEAIQMIDKISLAMGATPAVAYEMRERLGSMLVKGMEHAAPTSAGPLPPPREYDLVDCYDGGPHDLDPDTPGLFPQTKELK